MREIAKKVGVNPTTVSRALRKDPRVKLSTRIHIEQAAEEMGYTRDAALSALNAYRNQKQSHRIENVMAWVTNFSEPDGWRQFSTYTQIFEAMQPVAAKAGYRVEEFWVNEQHMPSKRLSEILRARGIRGVFLGVTREHDAYIQLDWEHFSALSLCLRYGKHKLNAVRRDYFHDVELSTTQLIQNGARRPIFILKNRLDQYQGRIVRSAFESTTRDLLGKVGPVFVCPQDQPSEQIRTWIRKSRADAVLTNFNKEYNVALQKIAPSEHPLCASLHTLEDTLPGILFEPEVIATTAIHQLIGMMHRFEQGIPHHPLVTHIPGRWTDGKPTIQG